MFERIAAHVGHGKTGSSYIQSSLALSTVSLAENSIRYPVSDSLISRAKKGLMTSGNVSPNRDWAKELADFASLNQLSGTALVSNEGLFRTLFPRGLRQIEVSFPNIEIEVLLFTRDPLSMAGSAYQEFVKQAKTDMSFSSFLAAFDKPKQVFQFVKKLRQPWNKMQTRQLFEAQERSTSSCRAMASAGTQDSGAALFKNS